MTTAAKEFPGKLGEKCTRAIVMIDRDAISQRSEGDSRIPVCLSSEEPVRTYYGLEILQHTKDAIDETYSRNGLPFFADHEHRRQVGWLTDLSLDGDRRYRGFLTKGAHPDAEWLFRDMEEGRRPYVSLDYMILHAYREEHSEQEGDTWVADLWMPVGCSTVPIPADVTVGLGRSAERAATPAVPPAVVAPSTEERTMEPNTPAVVPTVATGPTLEARNRELGEITQLAVQHNMTEHLVDWAQRGLSRDQVATEILTRQRDTLTPTPRPAGDLDLTPRDRQRYSLQRAILAQLNGDWSHAGFERECHLAVAKNMGNRAPQGFFVPMASLQVSTRASVTGQSTTANADGAYAVQTDVMPMIDMLRNRMLVKKLGAQVYTGLTNNVRIPRQITANTFTWTGQNPSTPVPETKFTLDTVDLSPKTGMGRGAISRQALVQTALEQKLNNDLITICALGLDAAGLAGPTGGNNPVGILFQTGVNVVAIGGNGGPMTRSKLLEAEEAVSIDNADFGAINWVFTPELRRDLKETEKATGYPVYLWRDDNTVETYPAHVTNQLPKNLVKGTSGAVCHGAIYGDFGKLIVAEFGGAVDLLVNPYTYDAQGMVAVTAFLMADVGCEHPEGFAVFKDITT